MSSSLRRVVVAAIVTCSGIAMSPGRGVAQVQPRGLVTCESSGSLRTCPAATTWRGARLVKQISRAPCLQGESWGFDRRGIWVDKGCRGTFEAGDPFTKRGGQISPPVTSVRRLTCGVATGAQVQCQAPGRITGVRLVRELSSGRCRQNASWGFTDAFVWANRGCRGEFEVIVVAPGGVPGIPGSQLITCGVTNGQYAACPANAPIKEVRLMRDVSGAGRCQPPQNWGHSNAEIWTRNGCRGEFQVFFHKGAGPVGPVPPPTRLIACGLSTGQQVECKTDGYATGVRLVRDFSGRCRQGSTWGNTDSFIWTNRGCRGEFEVTYRTATY